MYYRKGVHRPIVAGIQNVVGVDVDGHWGDHTEAAVVSWHEDRQYVYPGHMTGAAWELMLSMMPLSAKIMEVIAFFEVGACRNAWSARGDISDGAGMNYGPLQVNKMGSIRNLKNYMPEGADFSEWIGTVEGAVATLHWFEDYHMTTARLIAENVMHSKEDRAIGLAVDAIVQGGFPPQNYVYLFENWPEGELWARLKAEVKRLYDRKNIKPQVSFQESVEFARSIGIDPRLAFAQLHPRSGVGKWMRDQLSRRLTWATGTGTVHGDKYDLRDFGITV